MHIDWRQALAFFCVILFQEIVATPCVAQDSQRQKPEQSSQQNLYRDQAQKPQQSLQQQSLQQQETQSYAGKVSEKHSKFYLEEARSKTTYQLEGTWSAKRYLGKKVRITGSLDAETNVLHVVTISISP